MKYFDEMQLLHEKAGCGERILHGTAGSGLRGVLGGPVRVLGRVERTGAPCDKTDSRAPEGLYGPAILRFLHKKRFKSESSSAYVYKAYISMLL